ncbi:hypothetical protein ACFL52_04670, partial [Candidatus Margulisiibacteriota bacterium]
DVKHATVIELFKELGIGVKEDDSLNVLNIERLHLQELINKKEKRKNDEMDKEYEYELELVK